MVEELHAAFARLGGTLDAPFMALSFMALPVIPSLKLTDQGLVDVERFQHVLHFPRVRYEAASFRRLQRDAHDRAPGRVQLLVTPAEHGDRRVAHRAPGDADRELGRGRSLEAVPDAVRDRDEIPVRDLDSATFVCVTAVEALTHNFVIHRPTTLKDDRDRFIEEVTRLIVGYLMPGRAARRRAAA